MAIPALDAVGRMLRRGRAVARCAAADFARLPQAKKDAGNEF